MSLKATTIREVIAKLDSKRPLRYEERESWEAFYTQTDRRQIDLLITLFADKPRGYKGLFGGHSGNGKTTELSRFRSAPAIMQRFFIIDLDITELLNPDDLEVVELLLVILVEVFAFAEKHKVQIPDRLYHQYQEIEGHFRETVKQETEKKKTSTVAVFKKTFFFTVKGQAEVREILRTYYRPRIEDLIRCLNDLLLEISAKEETKSALIMIDGLDRVSVDKARKLFVADSQNLAMIQNASMLLTVPISIIHSPDSSLVEGTLGKIMVFKNLRLKTREGQQDEGAKKNCEVMRDFILKRMDADLIEEAALEKAIHYSGGVFRTLMDLVSEAAVYAVTYDRRKITAQVMGEAIRDAKVNKSRPLTQKHWNMLRDVARYKVFLGDNDDDTRRKLLQGLFALEYINGGEWYDINPLLDDGLKRFERLSGDGGETGLRT